MTRWIAVLLALSSLAGAQEADGEVPLSEGELALIAANEQLAWKLVAQWPAEGNQIVVPLPLLVQLRAMSVGMPEAIVDELAAVAGVAQTVDDAAYASLVQRLTSKMPEAESDDDGGVVETEAAWNRNRSCTLQLPSLLLYDQRIAMPDHVVQRLAVVLGEAPVPIDTREREAARARANAWLERVTDGLLGELDDLPTLDPDTPGIVSLSAFQLRAGWYAKFLAASTRKERFRVDEGRRRVVSMMSHSGMQPWAADERAQVVRRMASGGIHVDFALSAPGRSVLDLEAQFVADGGMQSYLDALDSEVGRLRVPRFDVRSEWDVAAMMRALGVDGPFDPQRAKLGDTALPWIDARQVSALAVDEHGICATSLTRNLRAAGSTNQEPFDFHADRPFLVVVRHAETDAVLLIARIADPGDAR